VTHCTPTLPLEPPELSAPVPAFPVPPLPLEPLEPPAPLQAEVLEAQVPLPQHTPLLQ
jgi:hypothetical protein